jgi:hypothetical protein
MAKKITKYTVFVSSPSDLKEERAALDEVVKELNLRYGAANDCIIELLKWETHSAPGISIRGSQDLISEDIGSDYDIFLGLLWTRFGTATKSADSGTEDEFNRALKQFNSNHHKPQILFYFKNSPPTSLNDIEPEQFLKVQQFKQSLPKDNVLFWEFDKIESLQNFVRLHLPKRIEMLDDTLIKEKSEYINSEVHREEDELGLLDYLDQYVNLIGDSTNSLERITEATEWIGEEIANKGEEITRIVKAPNSNKALVRIVFKRTAKLLQDYAERVKSEIPIFYSSFEDGMRSGINLINLYDEFNGENNIDQLESSKDSILKLQASIGNALDGVTSLRNSVSKIPRIQKEINTAKLELLTHLNDLIEKLESCLQLSTEFSDEIGAKLDKEKISRMR